SRSTSSSTRRTTTSPISGPCSRSSSDCACCSTGSRPARPPVPEHDDALPAVAGRASSKQAGSAHRRDQQGGPCIDQVRILDVVLLDQDVDGNTRLSGDL